MSKPEFQVFETRHLPDAGGLHAACFNQPPWEDGWTGESASRRLETLLAFPTAVGVVAILEERLLGLALGHIEPWTDSQQYYLNELCVEPTHQRRGLGGALLRDLTQRLAERGIEDTYLVTDRASPAEAFFARHGFSEDTEATKLWRTLESDKTSP